MNRLLLIAFLFVAAFSSQAQNKVEEVVLKSGKIAVLYDNGLWIYKETPQAQGLNYAPNTTVTKASSSDRASSPTRTDQPVSASAPCGAKTKTTGAPCRRMVKGGGRCYQHQ